MQCASCGVDFVAPAGALTCSPRCRVAAHRARRSDGDLPTALTQRDRWVLHDRRKMPRQVSNAPASSTNPATWTTYDVARAGARGRGLGFVLNGDGVACIDLDHCLSGGRLEPWASDIVDRAGRTYIEVSPSGTGLHIWGKASVGRGRRMDGVEVYDRARYVTITARPWRNAPLRLQSIQVLVDSLVG